MDLYSAFRPNATAASALASGGAPASRADATPLIVRSPAPLAPATVSSAESFALDDDLAAQVGDQLDALGASPQMREMYYITLMIMQRLSPDSVRGFVKSMSEALDIASPDAAARSASASDLALQSSSSVLMTLDVHVEMMTTEISMRVGDGGAEMSATLTRLRVDIRAQMVAVRQSTAISPTVAAPEDPLTLDLNGNGEIDLDRTRRFDLSGQGRVETIPFVSGGDAFLALDRNGNGRIDDGRELFGDQHGAANGFDELARFDENGDGRIDASDAVYRQLQVLGDFDGDGADEQKRLIDAGVTRIDLGYQQVQRALGPSATLAQVGRFWQGEREALAGALLLRHV